MSLFMYESKTDILIRCGNNHKFRFDSRFVWGLFVFLFFVVCFCFCFFSILVSDTAISYFDNHFLVFLLTELLRDVSSNIY